MKSILQKEVTKISLYFAFVLLFGALIAPALFNLGKGIAGMRIIDGWLHEKLSESEFPRYFNRAILLAALVGLVPLLKSLKIRRADMALVKNPCWKSHFGVGFSAAAGLLLLMGAGYVLLKIFKFDNDLSGSAIITVVTSAVAVALLEEFLFRGAIFGVMLRTTKPLGALVFVTFFYTIVHFLKAQDSLRIADADVNWGSGFWMVGQIFANFGNPLLILSAFVTLFAVGWILGVARMRTGSLWLSIGLHCGWVFGLKLFSKLTSTPKAVKRGEYLPWVGDDLKKGLVPLVFVALTGAVVFLWLRKSQPRSVADEPVAGAESVPEGAAESREEA